MILTTTYTIQYLLWVYRLYKLCQEVTYHEILCKISFYFCWYWGRGFAAALSPRLLETNPRLHHKGATARVWTGNQQLPVLFHCQLGKDIRLINLIVIVPNFGQSFASTIWRKCYLKCYAACQKFINWLASLQPEGSQGTAGFKPWGPWKCFAGHSYYPHQLLPG